MCKRCTNFQLHIPKDDAYENVRSAEDILRCHNEFIRDAAISTNLFLSSEEWRFFYTRKELDNDNGSTSNWTITPVALNAARVYLELSRMKGAWGAGWMDIGILRNIEALKRRFGEESRGKSLNGIRGHGSATRTGKSSLSMKKSKSTTNQNQTQTTIQQEGDGWDIDVMLCALHLSNSISQVLKSNDYWNWSKDAKDALLLT